MARWIEGETGDAIAAFKKVIAAGPDRNFKHRNDAHMRLARLLGEAKKHEGRRHEAAGKAHILEWPGGHECEERRQQEERRAGEARRWRPGVRSAPPAPLAGWQKRESAPLASAASSKQKTRTAASKNVMTAHIK